MTAVAPYLGPRFTLHTEAACIIREELVADAKAKLKRLADATLRRRLKTLIAEDYPAERRPDPATMSRNEMIDMLADGAGGYPITMAITGDDPLVLNAKELRRENWARTVAAAIKEQGLTGETAARYRIDAEEAELAYLRQLTAETWELPEAELRVRVFDILGELTGGDREFPYNPNKLSRGETLTMIADHIRALASEAERA